MSDATPFDRQAARSLRRRPGSHGTIVAGQRCLNPELVERRAGALASALQRQGLKPAQVVLCPDTPALDVVSMRLALHRVGAALLPYRAGLDQVDVEALSAATGAEWHWRHESAELSDTGIRSASPLPHPGPALLVKTSGSSGGTKVVMLTAENLGASAVAVNHRLGFGADDVWLCCLRLSHIGGLAIIDRWAYAGATLILHDGFDADAVAAALHLYSVTHVSLVPPMLSRLLEKGAGPPASLRVALVGGQALGQELAERAIAAGWPLRLTYGMTETTSQIATSARALDRAAEGGRVGPLLPGVEVDRPLSAAPTSRLRIRGPMVMAGYANPLRMPGQGLDDGWFETSDLGTLGDDGELRILGRADDVLVIGGKNISLARVEARLRRVPGVSDLMLVGLDDPVWGHRLVAVYCGALDEQTFDRLCAKVLSGAERPRIFRRVTELPLLDSGKYDRLGVRALALESLRE
jgi:O-succinylbenzoic acid--CoA ligase